MKHGHEKADARNLALHRLALQKFREDPAEGKKKVLALLDRWSSLPHLQRQMPFLEAWRAILDLPVDEVEATVLSDASQPLRQCSPLGVLITPQERFAAYRKLLGLTSDRGRS